MITGVTEGHCHTEGYDASLLNKLKDIKGCGYRSFAFPQASNGIVKTASDRGHRSLIFIGTFFEGRSPAESQCRHS